MLDNIILMSDSYKVSHHQQYPPKTKFVFSYLESRGGKFDATVFFGLQYFLKRYFEGKVVTKEKIDQAEMFLNSHLGPNIFNRKGWEYILEKHNGHLPVIIKAVKEGSKIPVKNVLLTIENTDPNCYWLTSYLETILLQVWYPTTVATMSHNFKRLVRRFQEMTGNEEEVDFKVHDFGYRGCSSPETAAIGAAAHLTSFKGTDTMAGIELLLQYYNPKNFPGFSIPASEHSTMTSWTKSKEMNAYKNMLESYPDEAIVAVVSDSYNIYKAVENYWGKTLKNQVLSRKGTLVIRPDSGDAEEVVNNILDILENNMKEHITVNEKGFKLLPPQVRIIQGDGMDYDNAWYLYNSLKLRGWSSDNLNIGIGGGLLQKINRDTQKFAIKCSQIIKGDSNKVVEVFKEPVTAKFKRSKKGRLILVKEKGIYRTVNVNVEPNQRNELIDVFKNGKILKEYTLDEIRETLLKHEF